VIFAIRGEVLRGFLKMNQNDFTASRNTAKLENTEIASQGVTMRVPFVRNPMPINADQHADLIAGVCCRGQ